jgi:hypothetical protein
MEGKGILCLVWFLLSFSRWIHSLALLDIVHFLIRFQIT